MDNTWSKNKLAKIVQEVLDQQRVRFPAVEAAVVWSLHQSVLVAQLRNATNDDEWYWLIGGEDLSTDIAAGAVATTPKELVRYFALRWQIGVEHLMTRPDVRINMFSTHEKAKELQKMAEGLYALAETEDIW
jgi:hypothetical protein